MLTLTQLQALKAAIDADPALSSQPDNPDGHAAIVAAFKAIAVPDFWVWRTSVSRADLYSATSPNGTTWNWTTFKNQSATEQGAWREMFMGDRADFSKPNVRAGVAAIFTGSAQANEQRDHCLAIGRRLANRLEKLFATGTGSTSVPATMVIEGSLEATDVETARNLP